MTSIIRGSDGFDSSHMQFISSSDDVSSSGDSLGQNIVVTFDDAKYVRIDFALQPTDDNYSFRMRCGSGGTVDTGANYSYFDAWGDHAASPTYGDIGGAAGSSYMEACGSMGASGDESLAGSIEFYVIDNGTVEAVHGRWTMTGINAAAVRLWFSGSGIYTGTQFPTNAFEIYHSGATDSWSAGWYRALGYK